MKKQNASAPPEKNRGGWLKKLLKWISAGNKKAYKNGCPT